MAEAIPRATDRNESALRIDGRPRRKSSKDPTTHFDGLQP
jgi:hypothetical protein